MKKERNLVILLCFLILVEIILLIFLPITRENWLSMSLIIVSIYLFFKTYFFRSDSSLFLALFCLHLSVLLNTNFAFSISLNQLFSLIAMSISSSFLLCYLIFHNIFCFSSFLVNFLTTLPMLLYFFNCINLIILILSLSGEIVLLFAILTLKKYGKI